MQRNKADAYVGLCRKAGKLTCGFNAVEVQRGGVYLLLLCHTASENAKKIPPDISDRIFADKYILCAAIGQKPPRHQSK